MREQMARAPRPFVETVTASSFRGARCRYGRFAACPRSGAPRRPPSRATTMREVSIAEAELLEQLSELRLLSTEVDPDMIRALERDGMVRRMPSGWRITAAGALAMMAPASS